MSFLNWDSHLSNNSSYVRLTYKLVFWVILSYEERPHFKQKIQTKFYAFRLRFHCLQVYQQTAQSHDYESIFSNKAL